MDYIKLCSLKWSLQNFKSGSTLVSNPNFKQVSNGCGPKGFEIRHDKFLSCCNSHDQCYGKCKSNKLECDEIFKACMQKICGCSDVFCNLTADLFFKAVRTFACDSFEKGQKNACMCKENDSHLLPTDCSGQYKAICNWPL